MTFNHRQKVSALGHVVALVAILFLCYVSFLGMVYMMGGSMVTSAMIASAMAVVLFILVVSAQKLKATSSMFGMKVKAERMMVLLLLLACGATWLPFSHFFSIYSHEDELTALFQGALAEVMPMFDDYENAANKRLADYQAELDKVARGKAKSNVRKKFTKYGVGVREEGKPQDGDQLLCDDMNESLRLWLFPPTYNILRQEALQWVTKAGMGATTCNAFLIGNTREIVRTVTQWQQYLNDRWNVKLNNEPTFVKDSFPSQSEGRVQKVSEGMDKVAELCSQRSMPPPYAFLLALVCWLLIFLPYWLQNRHSKSWEHLLPTWMRLRGGKNQEDEDITKVKLNWDKDRIPFEDIPKDETAKFRTQLQRADDPFLHIMGLMEQGKLTPEKLVRMLSADHNLMDGATVKECLDRGVFTKDQLERECGFDSQMVEMLGKVPEDVLPEAGVIRQLPEATTEVFFWGIPSSGKTCALGVVLAAAKEGTVAQGMSVEEGCQGHEYYQILCRIFPSDGTYCLLPGRTPVTTNFAIHLHLEDRHHHDHPITLVDMAGELFCALLWKKHGRDDQVTDNHRRALEEFEKILVTEKSEHQKFHFFIIEYGAEDKKYKGFDQDTYLEYGLRHLNERGVLENATEGIYVIVTKTDQVKHRLQPGEDEATHLSKYLMTYYPNFIGLLDQCCRKYELCGGKLPDPIPFDIGEVNFCNCCHISTERARDVVKVMLARSKGFRQGLAGRIERWFDT
ncbi:MAG: hypothetical protein IKR05_14875 [Prevotella sp.]|nr:hypothetical protein [Prevotella sp.]